MNYVPAPYDDEVFVSWYARIRHHILLRGQTASKEFFRMDRYPFNLDFPTRIKLFVDSTQFNKSLDAEYIVQNHTLLPFYEHFISRDKRNQIFYSIEGNESKNVKIGAFGAQSTNPTRLPKICPLCAEKDLETLGEIYFHREHQLPDALICVTHKVFLSFSETKKLKIYQDRFSYPSDVSSIGAAKPVTDKTLYEISATAKSLISSPRINFYTFDFASLCHQKGYTRAGTRDQIDHIRLHTATSNYYSSLEKYYNYKNLFNFKPILTNGERRLSNPLRYLLLYNFLQRSENANNQTQKKKIVNIFGAGPWPCKNKICSVFGKASIRDIKLEIHKKERVKGTVHCDRCGMTYTFFQNKTSDEHSEVVVEYGEKWANFVQKKLDEGVSRHELCKILGMSDSVIGNWAARYNLRHPWPKKKSFQTRDYESKKIKRRQEWLNLMASTNWANPSQFGSKYHWFLKHDRDWYFQAKQKFNRVIKRPSKKRKDWDVADKDYSTKIKKTAKLLYSNEFRVSKKRLIFTSKLPITSKVSLSKLPLTVKALNEFSETSKEFRLRQQNSSSSKKI